jgi:hypothetical protein
MKRVEIPIHEVTQHKGTSDGMEAYLEKKLTPEGFYVNRPITSTVDNKTGMFIFEQEAATPEAEPSVEVKAEESKVG